MTTAVSGPLPCPSRPDLEPITIEEQIEIQPDVLLKFGRNQLKLKNHIMKLESLSGCRK